MAFQISRRSWLARIFSVALLAIIGPWASAADLRQQIDTLAEPLVKDGTSVGIVVGVLRDGQTQIYGYGETAKDSKVTPDGDTLFEIGSISKVFTCLLLADMVERGLVKLDDPVQKYLPDDARMPIAEDQPIKLVDLATHTSGLPRLPSNMRPADFTNPYADYVDSQLFAFLNDHKLRRPPGKYEYSNLGMGLLGAVLARHAGISYEQLLADRITGPLAMNDTQVTLDETHRKRLATSYNAVLKPQKPWDFQALAGAGGIRSTARDMLKFAAVNIDSSDAPLAKASRLAHTKRCEAGGKMSSGLGWLITDNSTTRWHNGATTYHAFLSVIPDRQVGVVVLANKESGRITQLGDLVLRAALGGEVQPLPPPKPLPVRKEIEVDPAIFAKYAGTYSLSDGIDFSISAEDGKLLAHAAGQPKVQLFATSPTEFFLKDVAAQLTFVLDPGGNVTKLIVENNGQRMDATKKK